MNKLMIIALLLATALAYSPEASAQDFSGLDKSPLDVAYYRASRGSAPAMRVLYSRPQMNGRKVFGNLPGGLRQGLAPGCQRIHRNPLL
ncbi:MAG: hypothetical protein KDD10_18475 [Phaeodactylibacter sp.]|nr:hypothetical protein [Phaeodactylibacter sp.]